MNGYKEVFSSNNPVELDRMLHLLEQSGIDVVATGRNALYAGNVEITGIRGARLLVPEDKVKDAQSALRTVGYETQDNPSEKTLKPLFIGLGIILLAVLIFMIYAAISGN